MSLWDDIVDAGEALVSTFAGPIRQTGETVTSIVDAGSDLLSNVTGSGSSSSASAPSTNLEAPTISMDQIVDFFEKQRSLNEDAIPVISEESTGRTMEVAAALDAAMARRFRDNLNLVLPDYQSSVIDTQREALSQISDVATQMSSGQLPEDVVSFIERQRAERGLSQGLFGQAADTAELRDLGIQSLQAVQYGAQLNAQAVIPGAQALGQTALMFTPPVIDMQSMFSQQFATQAQGQLLDPGSALQAGVTVAGQNAQLQWAAQLSQANLAMDLYQTQLQQQMNQQAIGASQLNSILGLAGTIGGAYIGGAPGAAVGSQLAQTVGAIGTGNSGLGTQALPNYSGQFTGTNLGGFNTGASFSQSNPFSFGFNTDPFNSFSQFQQ